MNRIKYLKSILVALVSTMFVGCNIDSSYDLSQAAEDSSLSIGTDDTYFDLPLAEINLSVSVMSEDGGSLSQAVATRGTSLSSASDMLSTLDEISTMLPSDLDGEYADGVDLSRLGEAEYTSGLVDILFEELSENEEKRVDFAELVLEKSGDDNEEYSATLQQLEVALGVELTSFESADSCADAIKTMLDSDDAAVVSELEKLKGEVSTVIVDKSESIDTVFTIRETVNEAIEIGEDVVDMLEKNLDGDKNTLSLLFTTNTNLPLDITLTPAIELSNGTIITIAEFAEAASQLEVGTNIDGEQLREILQGMTFTAVVTLNNYDPSISDLDIDGKYIYVKLIARKRGSLIF